MSHAREVAGEAAHDRREDADPGEDHHGRGGAEGAPRGDAQDVWISQWVPEYTLERRTTGGEGSAHHRSQRDAGQTERPDDGAMGRVLGGVGTTPHHGDDLIEGNRD